MSHLTRRTVLLATPAAAATGPASASPQSGWAATPSHVSSSLSGEMRDYFTSANTKKLLAACENAGINSWPSRADRHIMRLLHEYRQEGGRIQWIAETTSDYGDPKRNLGGARRPPPQANR